MDDEVREAFCHNNQTVCWDVQKKTKFGGLNITYMTVASQNAQITNTSFIYNYLNFLRKKFHVPSYNFWIIFQFAPSNDEGR